MNETVPVSNHIQLPSLSAHYLEWHSPIAEGEAIEQKNILLLHGLTSCAQTWSFVAPLLSTRFNVYAMDLRGHGDTDKPDNGYDIDTLCEDVASFIETLGLQNTVVAGHSWGASVAARLAAYRPDLVSHLMMIDGGFMSPGRRAGMTKELWETMLAPEEIYATRATYLAAASMALGGLTPELEEIFIASVYMNPDGSVREKLSRDNQVLILRAMWDFHPHEIYSRLSLPTMFVAARSGDPEMQRFVERKEAGIAEMLKILPHAQVQWLDNSVHDLQLQRPSELAEVMVGFLKRQNNALPFK